MPVTHCIDYCSLILSFEIFFLKMLLVAQDALLFRINLKIDFPISAKEAIQILIGTALELQI